MRAGSSNPTTSAQPSNTTKPVDCAEDHTAETIAVGALPDEFAEAAYDDQEVGAFAYRTCSKAFAEFVGADESLMMRTVLNWAWFRPSEADWSDGARWYRCDVVGGGEQSAAYVDLPESAEGILLGKPDDRWLVCADGESVSGAPKVPCSEPHNWRAVHDDQARAAGRRVPRRPGRRGAHPRLLLGLRRGLAQLPGDLRLRLHVVPRGGVAGGQPAVGVLGRHGAVTARPDGEWPGGC